MAKICEPEVTAGIVFDVLDETGHTRLVWDRMDLTQIREARKKFDELIKKGHMAFRVGKRGKKTGPQIHKFDPSAEEVLFEIEFIPAVAGG